MYIRFVIFFTTLLFFSACQNEQTVPLPKNYHPKNINYKKSDKKIVSDTGFKQTAKIAKVKIKNREFPQSGYIKGIIKTIHYDLRKKVWLYEIRGIDTSNNKLSYAKATNSKKLAKKGDFVYALIQNGFIKSIYIYKKRHFYTFHKKKKIIKKIKIKKSTNKKRLKNPKIPHRKQIITAPKAEILTF